MANRKRNWFLMEETDPPSFLMKVTGAKNGEPFRLESCGGAGKGIVVELRAVGYNPMDYCCEKACLVFSHYVHEYIKENGFSKESIFLTNDTKMRQMTQVERHRFEDGTCGWVARFPDACFERGPNPGIRTKATTNYDMEHGILFVTGIFGDNYFKETFRDLSVYTAIRFYPMDNPLGVSWYRSGETIKNDGLYLLTPPNNTTYNRYMI